MNANMTNGRQRKNLADQIDRLDTMLDGLADNLNDAVAQAVKNAVALAVKEAIGAVLTEVLNNPALQAKLNASQAKQPEDVPPPSGFKQRLGSCWNWIGNQVKKVGEQCGRCYRFVRSTTNALTRRAMQVVMRTLTWARSHLLRAVCMSRFLFSFSTEWGIGLTFHIAAFFAGYFLSTSASDLKDFVVALVVRVWFGLRGIWGMLRMSGLEGSPVNGYGDRS